jgi:Xaa-Pro aminopeptidase
VSRQDLPAQLQAGGLDALVAFSLENVFFTSGTMLLTQRMIPTRLAITITYPDGGATMVVCSIEIAQVSAETWIKDIRTYTEFKDSPIAVLASVLKEKGLGSKRIGLELGYLAAAYHHELEGLLPAAQLVRGDGLLDRARVIKSADEIAIMRKAAIGTDSAIRTAFEGAHIGTTEAQMHETMRSELLRQGADGVAFVVMTTGENSKLVHPTPSQTRIKAGDLVRTDFGGFYGSYYGGYYSDLARMAIAGKPSDKQRDTYLRLREVFELLLRKAVPGAGASELYELCRSSFEQRGLTFTMPHIGHNIGVFIHEHPMLNPLTADVLEPGMVLAIEPITVVDGYIYHCEDEVVITEAGNELLSPAHDWSELMTIS